MRNLLFTLFLAISSTAMCQIDLSVEEFTSGLSSPVGIYNSGDVEDDRIFVLERSGRIRIVDGTGSLQSTSFLDINPIVAQTGGSSEQGLLGMAFHPDYANNGYFFVHYTDNSGDGQISRFTVDDTDPNLADAASEFEIINISQPYGNHNGGEIQFGPDGYLYIGLGDGGSFDDPENRSQNPQELLGKMLRIDIDNGTPFSIPADNPFVDDASTLDEIWSIGLRNPWRFSFDRITGDMWIGDVGQNQKEEIDFEPAGSAGGINYGWRCYEATNAYLTSGCGNVSEYTDPVVEISHGGFSGPCSITGGYVYRGVEYTDIYGKYIFADYCSGDIWAITNDGAGGFTNEELADINNSAWSSFGEDSQGRLYIASLTQGRIYKLTTAKESLKPAIELSTANILESTPGDFAPYTANQWYLDDEVIDGATSENHTPLVDGVYQLQVTTTPGGRLWSNSVDVTTTSINSPQLPENSLTVSPNPFMNNVQVAIALENKSNATLDLFSIDGKLLKSWKKEFDKTWNETIDLTNLAAGVYQFELKADGKSISKKIVKQ